jgi:hypothetical protein
MDDAEIKNLNTHQIGAQFWQGSNNGGRRGRPRGNGKADKGVAVLHAA